MSALKGIGPGGSLLAGLHIDNTHVTYECSHIMLLVLNVTDL